MALRMRTARRGLAALTGIVVAATLATGSASTTPPPGGASPDETAQAEAWTAGLAGEAPCPEGHSRSSTLLTEGFGGGVPQAAFNNGWRLVTRGLAGPAARSEVNSGDSEDWFFTEWAQAPVGAHTMFAFLSRGNVQASAYSRADVNSVSLQAAGNTESWRGKVFDVTAATRDESGRLGPWFQHRHQIGATQWWEVDNIQVYTCRPAAVSRLQGADRYDTSARIAAQFPAGQDVVYLASGTNFPDALAGAALAAKEEGPVLLVQQDRIPRTVAAELDRLDPARIVVFGGADAVGETVVEQAAVHTSGEVTRLAGANRYETSRAIADTYPAGISTVYVASGTDYPDALAGGAAAGRNNRPLLLTHPSQLPSATAAALDRLDAGRIVILGGPSAVSEAVARRLGEHTDGDVTRIAGANRYETAALIARTFPDNRSRVFVATGTDFPDALAGSAFAGGEHNPVLLAQPDRLPQSTRAAVNSLSADSGVLIGGRASVASIVLDQLGRYVG